MSNSNENKLSYVQRYATENDKQLDAWRAVFRQKFFETLKNNQRRVEKALKALKGHVELFVPTFSTPKARPGVLSAAFRQQLANDAGFASISCYEQPYCWLCCSCYVVFCWFS